MITILKELIEKPEKAENFILNGIKFLLIALVSSKIYSYYFGQFEPILIDSETFWKDIYAFFQSGIVFYVLLSFLFVRYIVYEVFEVLLLSFVVLISNNTTSNESHFYFKKYIYSFFVRMKIIEKPTDKLKLYLPGERFYLSGSIVSLLKDDLEKEMNQMLFYKIFTTYSFYLLSAILFKIGFSTISLKLLIGIWIFLFLSISIFNSIFKYWMHNREEFIFKLSLIKQIKLLDDFFTSNKIKIDFKHDTSFSHFLTFKFGEKEFGIFNYVGTSLWDLKNLPDNSKLIVITSKKLPLHDMELIKKNEKVSLIEYKNDDAIFIKNLEDELLSY